MITIQQAKIKQQMAAILNKWKDKPEKNDTSIERSRRIIDRMRYRQLKRELGGKNGKMGKKSTYEYARQIFKT